MKVPVGFGLVGLEAIAAGVPVLVSTSSGLGEVLLSLGGAAAACVVEVEEDEEGDAERWALAIEQVLDDRAAAFERARTVREQVAERCAWPACAEALLAGLGLEVLGAGSQLAEPAARLPERDLAFFGREELLVEVDAALGDPPRPGVVALEGEPGSGRGALALEAAWRRRQLYAVAWSLGGAGERLDDELGRRADELGLPGGAEAALGWLEEHEGGCCWWKAARWPTGSPPAWASREGRYYWSASRRSRGRPRPRRCRSGRSPATSR